MLHLRNIRSCSISVTYIDLLRLALHNPPIASPQGCIMEFQIEYWHWVVFGMLLILAELVVPSFTIFWFGLGALLMALLIWALPEFSLSLQLVVWAISSGLFALAWFRLLRPMMKDRTKAGIAREAVLGETGRVIQLPEAERRGRVRFTTPVLGDDEWEFICEQPVEVGDRVAITEISGNTLIVRKR
jgi:membrane protein implicated in regulation of membrane protease activity